MDKLRMMSRDKIEENIEKIGKMFPNCITEVKGSDGKVFHKVNYDILKQELADMVVDGTEERYQMTWPDKRKAILAANTPITKTLRPCREESVNFDTTENLYIEGDNLDVLKLLQENYLGKVKMIYIDPPYNTGNNSFVYDDDSSISVAEFSERSGQYDENGNMLFDMRQNNESNGRYHTDWLNMMYPRLKLARDLLTEDGVIFISIDDKEVHNLRKICDEIFGDGNFASCIPWQSRLSIQNDTDFSINHEYLFGYAKNRRQENRRLKESNKSIWFERNSFVFRPIPLDKTKFSNPDNDIRGEWKADPLDAPHLRPNLSYIITNPNNGEQYLPPKGRCWRTEKETYNKLFNEERIIFGTSGESRPQLKVFYEEKKAYGSIDNSWFSGDKIGTTTSATKELQKLFKDAPFDTPKPTSLLIKLIDLCNVETNDIILDFFSGSSTTAHAVMKLNAEDGGNRKYIMIQLPELCDPKSEAYKADYKNICEIGKERIRRAGKKIIEEITNDKLQMTKGLDTGFRVLKVDSSNMNDIYYRPEELTKAILENTLENIKKDRTSEDLLFQILLEFNLLLSVKIEKKIIDNKEIFYVNGNYLIACFDKGLNDESIKKIADCKPAYVAFRDSSFVSDSNRINVGEIFKMYSPGTEIKVV